MSIKKQLLAAFAITMVASFLTDNPAARPGIDGDSSRLLPDTCLSVIFVVRHERNVAIKI